MEMELNSWIPKQEKNPAYPKRMKFLIGELQKGILSFDEFNKECAYWWIEVFNDLIPENPPEKIPEDFNNWGKMGKTLQSECSKEYYNDHPSINWFAEKCHYAWMKNLDRVVDLLRFRTYLLLNDKNSQIKYYYKIKEFINALQRIIYICPVEGVDFTALRKSLMEKLDNPEKKDGKNG